MTARGFGYDLHLADAEGFGAAAPLVEVLLRSGLRTLIPELPQVLLEVVRGRQGLVQFQHLLQLGLLIDLLILLEVLRVHQQEPARALSDFAVPLVG